MLGFGSIDKSVGAPLSVDFSDFIIDACHVTVAAGLGLRDRRRSVANAKELRGQTYLVRPPLCGSVLGCFWCFVAV